MLFSFTGIIQPSDNEIQANKQIDEIWQSILEDNDSKDLYALNGILEAEEIEEFLQELSKIMREFFQNYKEK